MKKGSRAALTIISVLAFGAALSVIIFLIHTMVLRTSYRSAALEINDAILSGSRMTISRGDETLPAGPDAVDYYNQFLLFNNTIVFSGKSIPATDKSILLQIGENELTFTGLEDGSAIAVRWKTAKGEKNYIVRSQITFTQLNSYYNNYKRKIGERAG